MSAQAQKNRGRGRPKKSAAEKARDARQAREAIVEAAAEVVGRRGARDLSVDNVLVAAGVSRRTFYRYFRSKDDLLVALFQSISTQLIARMQVAMADAGALSALRVGLDAYLEYHAEAGGLLRVLTEEAIRHDSKLHPLRELFQQSLFAILDHSVYARHGRRIDPLVFVALIGAVEAVSLRLLRGEASPEAIRRAKAATHGLLEATLDAEAGLACLPDAAGAGNGL